jgi:hypothetical protein
MGFAIFTPTKELLGHEKETTMHPISFLRGVGLGAAAAYFLDPNRGRYRRALVRNQFIHAAHQAESFFERAACDLQHRLEGAACQLSLTGEKPSDDVLVARVRSQMGHCVMHPRNIQVSARDGRVTLRGPILRREARDLFQCVRAVRGVSRVVNELEIHERSENVPALQGDGQMFRRAGLCTGSWSPSTRLLAGSLGAALAFRGLMQRFPAACVNGTLGLALLARAFTSAPSSGGRRPSMMSSWDQSPASMSDRYIPTDREFADDRAM